MKLTREILMQGQSVHKGWSQPQLKCFGLSWPLQKGWVEKIVGLDFPESEIERFLSLKDAHITDKQRRRHAKRAKKAQEKIRDKPKTKGNYILDSLTPFWYI